jgi:hypothetical protein
MRVCNARALRAPIVLFVLLGSVAAARADAPAVQLEPRDGEPASASHWYGPRLLLADAATIAFAAASAGSESAPLTVLGLASWVLASPALHAEHAGLPRAGVSLALRLGLPALGFAIAQSTSDGCWRAPNASDTCDIGAEITGVMLGAIFAEIIDVAMVAHDSHAVAPPPPTPTRGSAQLLFAPKSDGGLLGIAGSF